MLHSRIIALRGQTSLPPMVIDTDFTVSSGSAAWTCARTQTTSDLTTDLLKQDASGATIGHFAQNTIRWKTGKGVIVETGRTNRFLNSEAPVTQTVNLPTTGSWFLVVNGSGSATVAANTAVGTGFGVATNGNPVNFTLSSAGTVDITVSGTLFAVNLETGTWASSFIKTAGAALARNIDVITLNDVSQISLQQGTIIFEWEDLVGNNGSTSEMLYLFASSGNTIVLEKLSSGIPRFVINSGGSGTASLVADNACVAGNIYRAAVSWKENEAVAYFTGSLAANKVVDTNCAMPVGAAASVNLGTTNAGGSPFNNRIRRAGISYKPCKAAALKRWAQAA